MDSEISQRQARQGAQQSRERNKRQFARRARRGLEAAVQTLGFGQLTDVPQQECRECRDQEQRLPPQRRARAADVLPHTVPHGLVVAEVLLDLHAVRVERDDLFGGIPAQPRPVHQEPRFAGAGLGLARGLRGRTVSRAAIGLALEGAGAPEDPTPPHPPHPPPPEALDLRNPRPPKARVRDHDYIDILPDPTVQGIEQRTLGLGVAELRERIDLLIDRDPPSLPGYGGARAQLHKRSAGTHGRPVDGDDERVALRLQSRRDGGRHPARFGFDAGVADQPVDALQRRLQPRRPAEPPRQARETEQVSLHERGHRRPEHPAPGRMDGEELRFDEALYNNVRVHVVGPPRWLVPKPRTYRNSTRSFCTPCLQYVEWEGISLGKGGETSGRGESFYKSGTISSATMLMILIMG